MTEKGHKSSSHKQPSYSDEGETVAYPLPVGESAPDTQTPSHKSFPFLDPPRSSKELGWLARYRIIKLIGRGGMGMVFLAEDSRLKRSVALKVIRPDRSSELARKRFLREARACARLEAADHIVTVYDVGEHRGVTYLAMQYLKGMTLRAWREKHDRSLSIAQLLRVGKETARGLATAHEHGLIHRDIKPANLWIEAPSGRIKILDFGLARSAAEADSDDISILGNIVGTPGYMSPEQADGNSTDARSDLFSLGCVLYELATGQLPFRGKGALALIKALATQTPEKPNRLNASLPAEFSNLIERLLALNPSDRPQSAKEVVLEIEQIEQSLLRQQSTLHGASQDTELFGNLVDDADEPTERARNNSARDNSKLRTWLLGAGAAFTILAGFLIWKAAAGKSQRTASTEPDTQQPQTTLLAQPQKPASDRALDERDRDRFSKMSAESQKSRIIAELEKRNIGFRAGRGHSLNAETFGGNAIKSVEIRSDILEDLSALRALPELTQVTIAANGKKVDLSGLAGLPLSFFECRKASINLATMGDILTLRHLDLSNSTVASIDKWATRQIETMILSNSSIANLDWLPLGANIRRLELAGLSIQSLQPLERLMKLEYLDFTGCASVKDIGVLAKLPLREVRCTYAPTFRKVLKDHPTLQKVNGMSLDDFFRE